VASYQRIVPYKSIDKNSSVKHCTLLLGPGVQYTKILDKPTNDLGVRGRPLETLLRKLHFKSVQAVGEMWKHRRALLHNKLGSKKGRTTGTKRANPTSAPQHRTTKKFKK
jgi:hypothetical protein